MAEKKEVMQGKVLCRRSEPYQDQQNSGIDFYIRAKPERGNHEKGGNSTVFDTMSDDVRVYSG
ncbi:MAG: hypothetical protein C4520_07055 [Candidatus Abyssobacteria bacterium SURF_5]|uniref:Uncharacterized protein n=1 Tax=Abyssobacteria bacterium (strain SURF_5) TaxID=2093360 RepID=A0A3A4NR04_ABYX5|nr:MAG: hypothetical protein C4520_07055 [Candidatus Abyssubacteria bacterium SURF_5]